MFLKQYYVGSLANASYLVGDEVSGVAAVVDPRSEMDQYLRDAHTAGMQIQHVILTHFHTDFVSAHLDFRDRLGAEIHIGARGVAEYPFTPARDGDVLELGAVHLRFLETPGRTPESICAVVVDTAATSVTDWGEAGSHAGGQEGSGAPALPGDATWIHTFFPGSIWAAPGGSFAVGSSATTVVAGLGIYVWGSTAAMVGDVQSWLDTPAGNFGWVVIGDEIALGTAKRFDTLSNPSVSLRPVLTIDYTPLPVEPTLPALGPIGLGALVAGLTAAWIYTRRSRIPPGWGERVSR